MEHYKSECQATKKNECKDKDDEHENTIAAVSDSEVI
jgi:hypothetical protein